MSVCLFTTCWRDSVVSYAQPAFRYAIRSFLSLAFFRPAKTILVPAMYFLGFSKYSNKVSSSHTMPLFTFAAEYE